MQLMPKQLIGNIGGTYLKNSKSVLFHPTPCEALESLTKMMTAGFVSQLIIYRLYIFRNTLLYNTLLKYVIKIFLEHFRLAVFISLRFHQVRLVK